MIYGLDLRSRKDPTLQSCFIIILTPISRPAGRLIRTFIVLYTVYRLYLKEEGTSSNDKLL